MFFFHLPLWSYLFLPWTHLLLFISLQHSIQFRLFVRINEFVSNQIFIGYSEITKNALRGTRNIRKQIWWMCIKTKSGKERARGEKPSNYSHLMDRRKFNFPVIKWLKFNWIKTNAHTHTHTTSVTNQLLNICIILGFIYCSNWCWKRQFLSVQVFFFVVNDSYVCDMGGTECLY